MGKEKSLRELAREQSLLLPSDSEEPKFRFDLNLGEIVTPKDVEKVRRLVELARITNRGDYISLISLISEYPFLLKICSSEAFLTSIALLCLSEVFDEGGATEVAKDIRLLDDCLPRLQLCCCAGVKTCLIEQVLLEHEMEIYL